MKAEKTYNIIGTDFKGVMVFKFNLNGILTAFELNDAEELNEKQIAWLFSRHFPYRESQINNLRAIKQFTVTEGEFNLTFEMFWIAFKYKVKRVLAEKAWEKLSDDDKIKAIAGIRHYDAFLFRKRNQDKAYPSTYLNQRYWEDEFGSAV